MNTLEDARQQGQRDGMTYAAAMITGGQREVCAQIRAKLIEQKSVASKTVASPDQGQRAFAERELEYIASFEDHAAPFAITGGEVSI